VDILEANVQQLSLQLCLAKC